jgi:hypothetical protein
MVETLSFFPKWVAFYGFLNFPCSPCLYLSKTLGIFVALVGLFIRDAAKVDFVFDKACFCRFIHLFLASYVIYILLKYALFQYGFCLFLILTSFILSRVRGTVLFHITPALLVGVCSLTNFIVFSQFSWPKELNILWWDCVRFYNAYGEFLLIDVCTHYNSSVYYVWGLCFLYFRIGLYWMRVPSAVPLPSSSGYEREAELT